MNPGYRWITRRGMTAHKVGCKWKFKVSEIDAWVCEGNAGEDGRKS